jgi:RHS repeat-associated protein
VYDAANQLTSYGSTTYSYDRNGNQVTSGNDQLVYDVANRWIGSSVSGQSVEFSYDGMGRSVSRSVAGARTDYWYDATGLVLESGAANATYLRDPDGTLRSITSAGATHNYAFDHLGSITALVSTNGDVANTYTYTPYGYVQRATGTVYNPFKFTGSYHDGGSYYQMGARYYHQSTGRFTQLDPLASTIFEGQRYAYALNNPTNYTDPTGLSSVGCTRTWYGKRCTMWFTANETLFIGSHLRSYGDVYGILGGAALAMSKVPVVGPYVAGAGTVTLIYGALVTLGGRFITYMHSRGYKVKVTCYHYPFSSPTSCAAWVY